MPRKHPKKTASAQRGPSGRTTPPRRRKPTPSKTRRKPTGGAKKPKTARSPAARAKRRKTVLALVAAVLLIGSGFWLYTYSRLTRLIDAHLKYRPPAATAILSRPVVLRVGRRSSPQQLAALLGRLHGSGPDIESSPARTKHRLRFRRQDPRQTVEVAFDPSDQRIVGIRLDGRAVHKVELSGLFLSNLFGPGRKKQRRIPFSDLPRDLVQAVLAAEDDDFFSHSGIDFSGMTRALWVNLKRLEKAQGGSTLTQQFVKNFFLSQEKSFRRKFEEIFLAVLLENRFGKEEIFELYADNVYLGQSGSFALTGFGQAASAYFGKDARHLTLAEAALLAGIIQAPNRFAPSRHPQDTLKRRNFVLARMRDLGMIAADRFDQAVNTPLSLQPPSRQNAAEAPYFVDFLRETLAQDWAPPDDYQKLIIHSTLDADLQLAAYGAVKHGLKRIDARFKSGPRPQVALVALDPRSGELLAMIGGRDYGASQFNRAVKALRQPGSTFKPVVYSAALRRKVFAAGGGFYTLARRLTDEPYTFVFDGRRYSPRNYSRRYRGPVSLRDALALSLNVPTVKLAEEIGFATVSEMGHRIGIKRPLAPYPSIALGTFELTPLELALAYSVFADQGRQRPLQTVRRVEVDGKVQVRPAVPPQQVLEPEVAFLIDSALGSVLSYGTGKAIRRGGFDLPAAGKTGSTDDAWFVGFTPDLVCVVWVGFDEHQSIELSGGGAALPIWLDFMTAARDLGHLKGQAFAKPEGILAVPVDRRTGLAASSRCNGSDVYTEYFIRGTEPLQRCLLHGRRFGHE